MSNHADGEQEVTSSSSQADSDVRGERPVRYRRFLRLDFFLAAVSWLALIAFAALTVGPGLTGQKVFLGTDLLSEWAPWAAVTESEHVTNLGIHDTIDSVAPTSMLMAESGRQGTFALWDPYQAGGTEAGALPNSAMLSPLSLPWWLMSSDKAPAAVKLLEIAAVALGMQLLVRNRWRLPAFTAPLAALVFVSSGFMITWTNWPQTRVAALIPLLFWATDRLAIERRWIDIVPMALVTASLLLGGFPAVTAYAMYAAVAFFFVRSICGGVRTRDVLMSLLRSAAGVILGVALSAVQLLPFLWFSTHYVDFEARNFTGTLKMENLATVIAPRYFGNPDAPVARTDHFIESFSYVGAAAIVLVIVALILRPRNTTPPGVLLFFGVALVFVGAATYSDGLAFDILQKLPTISSSPIGRMRSILGFFAAVLVAFGAAAAYEPKTLGRQFRVPDTRRVRWVLGGIVSLLSAVLITVPILDQTLSGGLPEGLIGESVRNSLAVAALALLVVLVIRLVRWQVVRWSGMIVLIVAVTVPAISVAQTWWPLSDRSTFYPETPATDFLKDNLSDNRLASVGRTLSPGTASVYGLRSITGHTFASPQWHEAMSRVTPDFYRSPTLSSLPSEDLGTVIQSPVLNRFGVSYVVASPGDTIPGDVEEGSAPVGELALTSDAGIVQSGTFEGPIRGIELNVLKQANLPEDPGSLTVRVVANGGAELAKTSVILAGIDQHQAVALTGEDIGEGEQWHVELQFTDSSAEITLGTDENQHASIAPIRPMDDGIRVVHTGDATILEREAALDRIRWNSQELVIPDAAARLDALGNPETPVNAVILEHEGDAKGVNGTSSATLTSRDIDTNQLEISVDATGAGWVTIADSMRDNGWQATLDGDPVELADAEHAAVAVYVPSEGKHTIELSYDPPYGSQGRAISAASLALISVVLVGAGVQRIRKSKTAKS